MVGSKHTGAGLEDALQKRLGLDDLSSIVKQAGEMDRGTENHRVFGSALATPHVEDLTVERLGFGHFSPGLTHQR